MRKQKNNNCSSLKLSTVSETPVRRTRQKRPPRKLVHYLDKESPDSSDSHTTLHTQVGPGFLIYKTLWFTCTTYSLKTFLYINFNLDRDDVTFNVRFYDDCDKSSFINS